MAYTQLYYHIVIRTKHSIPCIVEMHEKELYKYIWGFCNNNNCKLERINGMPDHLHMLLSIHPSLSISSFIHDLKLASTYYIKTNSDKFPLFQGWSEGYCALTYSKDEKSKVYDYIVRQKEHHQRKTFREELIEVLTECGIPYDERYI